MRNLNEIFHHINNRMLEKFVKCIFIHQHLGLGDHIVCNGLTREIMQIEHDADFFFMPVKHHNYGTVQKMYNDVDKLILFPVDGDWNEIHNHLFLKFCCKKYQIGIHMTRKDWDVSFYDCVGLPFEKRWTSFKINRDYQSEKMIEERLNPTGEPFILIHDTASWGTCPMEIRNDIKVIRVDKLTESITDWCSMIEKAEEVHCIDSSFIHLCTSMGRPGTFHDFKKDSSWGASFILPDNWNVKCYNDLSGVSVPFVK